MNGVWVATFATSMTSETERFDDYGDALAWVGERQVHALRDVNVPGIRLAGLTIQSSIRWEAGA